MPLSREIEAKLRSLRQMLERDADPAEICDYFYEHIAEDEGFVGSGVPLDCPDLLEAFSDGLRGMSPRGYLHHPVLDWLEEQQLVSGYFCWGRGLALVLYFEEPRVGVISFVESPETFTTSYLSFSVAHTLPTCIELPPCSRRLEPRFDRRQS
jgi:hypothetical protein